MNAQPSFDIREALNSTRTEPVEMTPLLKGGSDRRFYRVFCGRGETFIFMHYDPARTENNYYAAIGGFLSDLGVGAPGILSCDPRRNYILMEDLGDRDLWSFRDEAPEKKMALYRRDFGILKLHGCDLGCLKRKKPVQARFDSD